MSKMVLVAVAVVLLVGTAMAQSGQWLKDEDPLVKEIYAKEKMWAVGNCSEQPGLKDVIADDFQGTHVTGGRYPKAGALEFDVKNADKNCQFGSVKVKKFGENLAMVYGNESSVKTKEGKDTKVCLVWTDTWLKRNGKWQIIAAQDNAVKCE